MRYILVPLSIVRSLLARFLKEHLWISYRCLILAHSSFYHPLPRFLLEEFFQSIRPALVLPYNYQQEPVCPMDFTAANARLAAVDWNDKGQFCSYVVATIAAAGAGLGAGGYGEQRVIYQKSAVFSAEEARSLHLGIDLWAPAGTPIFAPLPARIHSFANNAASGDYGPTLILEHELLGESFYTLYGHLSLESMAQWAEGKQIQAGEQIATLGAWAENVHWPPHLHFQLISDMLGKKGDFPGVCAPSEADYWLGVCPDPNLLLRIPGL